MYLKTASSALPTGPVRSSGYGPDAFALDMLTSVQRAFPGREVSSWRVDDSGGDHALLIVNDSHVFRFPRVGTHGLDLERKVLARLQSTPTLPTPVYDYVDPDRQFAGYRFISGSPLTPACFERLSTQSQNFVLADLAAFLRTLHRLEPLAIVPLAAWPRAWTAAEFADRALKERIPLLQRYLPQLAPLVARFFESYRLDELKDLGVVHGDLVPEHILFDAATEHLTGIIDFGDVALADPAQDMLGCWSYGPAAVAYLIEHYGAEDPTLFARSRNHFIRYRIDSLFEQLSDGKTVDLIKMEVSEVETLLIQAPTN